MERERVLGPVLQEGMSRKGMLVILASTRVFFFFSSRSELRTSDGEPKKRNNSVVVAKTLADTQAEDKVTS